MTDVTAYLEYFRKIATEHVSIKSFYVLDMNEPLSALRTEMLYPALIMNSMSGNFSSPNLDNILDEVRGGFLIIERLQDLDDFAGEMLLLQKMKKIGTDIISRMNHDLLKCEPSAQKAIKGFSLNSVSYQMMDSIFDNCFGFLFTYRSYTPVDMSYNPNLWIEEGSAST
jgi:hypothetical protein